MSRQGASADKRAEIREMAEADLYFFASLVNPSYMYGDVHKKLAKFLSAQRSVHSPNKLALLPRGHLKSHWMATCIAWLITKNPALSVLYVSATSALAEAQLYAIKNIITSDVYTRYWPEHVNQDEALREKWSSSAIALDHSKRKKERVRDMTVRAAGLTTNLTGFHCDIVVFDDVVVPDNAYTEEGRQKVLRAVSQTASIKNPGGFTLAVGTRYHPKDQYSVFKEQKKKVYKKDTETEEYYVVREANLWDIMEEVVEVNDRFLWPRIARPSDGKKFGFDWYVLGAIEAEYEDRLQFHAQYYNDPNDPDSVRVDRTKFQYYDPKFLRYDFGKWYFKDEPMNIYAAIDFAFSLNKKADWTSIVVIGMCPDRTVYILDIDRFKTNKMNTYFDHILALHSKWYFRKLRAEVTQAQQIIVNEIKDRVAHEGLRLSIDSFRPSRREGSKEERIAAALEHRYDNGTIYHYNGGLIRLLEDEIVMARPKHDDLKDSLAMALEIAVPPASRKQRQTIQSNILYHPRFGGVAR